MNVFGSSAKTAYYYKKFQFHYPHWKIYYKLKCKSTENELTNCLEYSKIKSNNPLVFFAKEQISGSGQHDKKWLSPRGGIWLSAAYPIYSKDFSSQNFNLSFAVKLCEILGKEKIKVNFKWPNDIVYESKKLIGFLPRIVTRGSEVILVRIGIGMNLSNKTPLEGISLCQIVNKKKLCEYYWAAKILQAICEAVEFNNRKGLVIEKANQYLSKKHLPKGYNSDVWEINNIDKNGNLRIFNEDKEQILRRF